MKHPMFAISLRKTMLMAVLVLLAMGACKSKKKAVEPAPAPAAKEEVIKSTPAPVKETRSADEIAVEKLESQFASIASASNVTAANQSIQEVLAMFSNPETPILVVIHEEGGVKDYDEPTTIKKYLEYLKDTKKNLNYISDIRLTGGKVTELELKRK